MPRPTVPIALRSLSMSLSIAPPGSLLLRFVLQADRCLALANLLSALSGVVLNNLMSEFKSLLQHERLPWFLGLRKGTGLGPRLREMFCFTAEPPDAQPPQPLWNVKNLHAQDLVPTVLPSPTCMMCTLF